METLGRTINTRQQQQALFGGTELILTDGGIETTFLFHEGYDLPEFAVFPLLGQSDSREKLMAYFRRYIAIAQAHGTGFILEAPTWRASQRWGDRLGYTAADLKRFNTMAIETLELLRTEHAAMHMPIYISGCVGPQDDGYAPEDQLSIAAAETYHRTQIETFAEAGADLISAITMTYPEEAIGIANAAASVALPVVIAFTVETDGRLPVGLSLEEAIRRVDAEATRAPAYYMINCAHPDHFNLPSAAPWLTRIGGLRANASRMSHAELDECDTLDDGNPDEFGQLYRALQTQLPNLRVLGGCCGTDHRHVAAAAERAGV